jgi:hypothetical protein
MGLSYLQIPFILNQVVEMKMGKRKKFYSLWKFKKKIYLLCTVHQVWIRISSTPTPAPPKWSDSGSRKIDTIVFRNAYKINTVLTLGRCAELSSFIGTWCLCTFIYIENVEIQNFEIQNIHITKRRNQNFDLQNCYWRRLSWPFV